LNDQALNNRREPAPADTLGTIVEIDCRDLS